MKLKGLGQRIELARINAKDFFRLKAGHAKDALWLRTHGFKRTSLRGSAPISFPGILEMGCMVNPVSMWLRLPMPPPADWKILECKGNASLFSIPGGEQFYLKMGGVESNPQIQSFRGTAVLKELTGMIRKGVRTEIPVGLLKTREGVSLLITKPISGVTLDRALVAADSAGKVAIAKSAAIELASIHNKGGIHGHTHKDNVIVDNTVATFIDPSRAIGFSRRLKDLGLGQNQDFADLRGNIRKFGGEEAARAFKAEYEINRKKGRK